MRVRKVFIIGGARSGKSSFALGEASKLPGPRVYLATAEALDEEMKERIGRHIDERGSDWETIEEPLSLTRVLSEIKDKYSSVLIDCLTLWVSNLLLRREHRAQNTEHRQKTIEECMDEFVDILKQFDNSSVCSPGSGLCNLYIVSNEVGTGIVPENRLARQFRDYAGMLNQKVAAVADEVYLVTAGIPLKIK